MKKILATVLALVMALALCSVSWADATPITEGMTELDTGSYVLDKDVTLTAGALTVKSGAIVTLDLGTFTLTNKAGEHTIVNNGTLTITGTGTVDNVSHARAALFNNEGATAVLNGGSFTRSQENGKTKEDSGNNSFYTIQNLGTMTINAGVSVTQNGCFSSMVANGYYNGTGKTNTPTMIINGGTFSGGLNTVKNDDCGVMTINGGEFKNFAQACVQNHNKLTITNGNFDGSELKAIADSTVSVIYNCGCGADNDKGMLSISGGTFSGGKEGTYVICDVSTVSEAYTDISGGTFTKGSATMIGKTASAKVAISGGAFKDAAGKAVDVSAYLAAGKQQNSDGSVGNKSYYYYPSTSDTTTSTTTKGSPKTFDAGVGIYAVTAVLSVTGMAWTAKKRH